jgi:hypothetical protein
MESIARTVLVASFLALPLTAQGSEGCFALIVPAEVRELRVAVLGPREAPDQARMHVVAADRENVLAR